PFSDHLAVPLLKLEPWHALIYLEGGIFTQMASYKSDPIGPASCLTIWHPFYMVSDRLGYLAEYLVGALEWHASNKMSDGGH
ncbi:MAG: hypothetical protein P8J29_03945, partial [Rhodospirillales bacterium]|nr:hypothetical protein [Rhodospirillales bacterium]